MSQTVTAYDYSFRSAVISSERLDESIDVSASIYSLEIFEHLDKAYLTGNVNIIDVADLMNRIDFLGSEYLDITIENSNGGLIERRFVLVELVSAVKTNDNSELITLHMVEDIYFQNKTKLLSKGYQGTGDIILATMLKDAEIEREVFYNDSIYQPDFRVITTFNNPFQATKFVTDRLTEENGMPYYLFSTVARSDKLILANLSTLLNEEPLNTIDKPFTYSRALAGKSIGFDGELEKTALNITNYKVSRIENIMDLMSHGHIASDNIFVDLTTGKSKTFTLDIQEQFDNLIQKGIIEDYPIYDKEFYEGLHTEKRKVKAQMYMSQLYQDLFKNIYEDFSPEENHKNKVIAEAFRNFITKSPIDIQVPGYKLMGNNDEDKCVGRTAYLRFLKNIIPDNTDIDINSVTDFKKSGKYLIYAARHTFSKTRHEVSVTAVKLSNLDGTTGSGGTRQ